MTAGFDRFIAWLDGRAREPSRDGYGRTCTNLSSHPQSGADSTNAVTRWRRDCRRRPKRPRPPRATGPVERRHGGLSSYPTDDSWPAPESRAAARRCSRERQRRGEDGDLPDTSRPSKLRAVLDLSHDRGNRPQPRCADRVTRSIARGRIPPCAPELADIASGARAVPPFDLDAAISTRPPHRPSNRAARGSTHLRTTRPGERSAQTVDRLALRRSPRVPRTTLRPAGGEALVVPSQQPA